MSAVPITLRVFNCWHCRSPLNSTAGPMPQTEVMADGKMRRVHKACAGSVAQDEAEDDDLVDETPRVFPEGPNFRRYSE